MGFTHCTEMKVTKNDERILVCSSLKQEAQQSNVFSQAKYIPLFYPDPTFLGLQQSLFSSQYKHILI